MTTASAVSSAPRKISCRALRDGGVVKRGLTLGV